MNFNLKCPQKCKEYCGCSKNPEILSDYCDFHNPNNSNDDKIKEIIRGIVRGFTESAGCADRERKLVNKLTKLALQNDKKSAAKLKSVIKNLISVGDEEF